MIAKDRNRSGRPSKVDRLIGEYELQPLGDELEKRWTAEGAERSSLRDLADYFNHALLEAVLDEAGFRTLDQEAANTYRLLTGDEVNTTDRTRVKRQLEREGVNVDQLLEEFVSYQAIRSYLRSHRNVEYSPPERDRTQSARQTIQRLRGKTDAVAQQKLEYLRDSGELTLGDFRTIVEIAVVCEDCGRRYQVNELLVKRGCACQERQDR